MKKIFLMFLSVVILTGCSVSDNLAMKVGDIEIKKEYIDYFIKLYNPQSGGTVSDDIARQAYKQAEMYGQMMVIGKKLNLEAQTGYNESINRVIKNYGSIEAYLEEAEVSRDLFDFLMYGTAYHSLLIDDFVKTLDISQSEIDIYFLENYWRAKNLLISTENKTDQEKKELKKTAQNLYNQAINGEDFDKLIDEYNEDTAVKNYPDGYVFTYNEMVPEFFDGVVCIDIGEYNLIETKFGYHIVKRLSLSENEELFQQLKNEKKINICQNIIADKYFRNNYWRAKHVLLLTQNKTYDEITEIKAKTEELYQEACNGADFDDLISKYNEDPGVEANPDGYVFTYKQMVDEFFDGVTQTEIGDFNLIETDFGYHIIKRLPLDETPELYYKFKQSKISEINDNDEADINELFLDYLNEKIIEYDIDTRDYTGMLK